MKRGKAETVGTEIYSATYHADREYLKDPIRLGSFQLYQVGRINCARGTVIKEHTHINLFELTLVTAGTGQIFTNGHGCNVKPGDIYLSFPGDFHKIISDEEEALMYDYCAFYTDDVELKESLLKIVELHRSPTARVCRDDAIPRIVHDLYEEIDGSGEYKERLLQALLEELTIRIIRDFATYGTEKSLHRENDSERICYRIMNYIDTHIYELHSLSKLAEIMSYNYNYLSNLFRAVTSQTLTEYYRTRKLETARLLLEEGAHSITETATLLGYSSVYTFSRAFKTHYGKPPSSISKNKS